MKITVTNQNAGTIILTACLILAAASFKHTNVGKTPAVMPDHFRVNIHASPGKGVDNSKQADRTLPLAPGQESNSRNYVYADSV